MNYGSMMTQLQEIRHTVLAQAQAPGTLPPILTLQKTHWIEGRGTSFQDLAYRASQPRSHFVMIYPD